jgi:hypothetical protein
MTFEQLKDRFNPEIIKKSLIEMYDVVNKVDNNVYDDVQNFKSLEGPDQLNLLQMRIEIKRLENDFFLITGSPVPFDKNGKLITSPE